MKRKVVSIVVAIAITMGMMLSFPLAVSAEEEQYLWPIEGIYSMSRGYYSGHYGIDITSSGIAGTEVLATKSGTIIESSNSCPHISSGSNRCDCNGGCGNYVKIKHDDGTYSRYLHFQQGSAHAKGYVSQGDVIGRVGSSGDSSGYHLHFEIYNTSNTRINSNPTDSRHTYAGSHDSGNISYIYELVPPCDHSYTGCGVCKNCGFVFDWESTMNYSEAGIYTATSDFTARVDMPYDDAQKTDFTVDKGDEVIVTGTVTNAYNNKWYFLTNSAGQTGYVYYSYLEYTRAMPSSISGSITSPAQDEVVPKKAFPVIGTVESNRYPLASVQAYLDGKLYATWTASNDTTMKVELRQTDINYNLDFANLSTGAHILDIRAKDNKHDGYVSVCSVRFYSGSKDTSCSHSYDAVVTKPTCSSGGYTTYTCVYCGESYEDDFTDALGHAYGDWYTDPSATCTTDGMWKCVCARCGYMLTQLIPATGHSYESVWIGATCVDHGKYRYTCTSCGDTYEEYAGDIMSEWSETKPEGVDESLIETKTQYKYQVREYTTSNSSTLSGWTLYDMGTQWGDYGAWSGWSDTAVSADDYTEVETRTVYGYYYYLCPKCGDHMHGYGTCYTWAGGCGASTSSGDWHAVWSTVSWDDANLKDWYGTGKYYTYIDGELVFKWSSGGSKTQYRYRTRDLETVYYFYKWSDWSAWSDTPIYASEDLNVETRTMYRYVNAPLGDHDYELAFVVDPSCTEGGYSAYACTVCGAGYFADYTDALGHSYGDWYVFAEATMEAPGEERRDCSRCGHFETREIPQKENPFSDVPEGQYYCDPVMWAVEKGITTGTGDGTTFSPERACTRAQVVTFLWRAAGCPEPQSMTHNFTDVKAGSYYENAVIWAVENGITSGKGSSTTFQPETTCNRAEVVTFLWRAKGKPTPESSSNPFPDVPAGSYYEQAVLWAVENGITTGKGNGTFAPTESCTRAHVVTFLYRAFAAK